MTKDMMIGVDLAKRVFQLHGASMAGHVQFRRRLTRGQFRSFMAEQPPAIVVIEACGSAHYWAREITALAVVSHKVVQSQARRLAFER